MAHRHTYVSSSIRDRSYHGGHDGASDDSAQRYLRTLQREVDTMRDELNRERQKQTDILRDLHESQEECRREQLRNDELRLEMNRVQDGVNSEKQLEISDLENQLQQLRQDLRMKDNELQTRDMDVQKMRDQMTADLDRQKQSKDNLDRLHNDLRRAKDEAENRVRTLQQEKMNLNQEKMNLQQQLDREMERQSQLEGTQNQWQSRNDQLDRQVTNLQSQLTHAQSQLHDKENTIRNLENNLDTQTRRNNDLETTLQGRADDAERQNQRLQTQLLDKENNIHSLQMELDTVTKRLVDLEDQNQIDASRRQESQRKVADLQRSYDEIASIVGASESHKQTYMLAIKVRELVNENARLQREELQGGMDSHIYHAEQLSREAANATALARQRDQEVASLREELIQRTRELRALTLKEETEMRDHRLREERAMRLEEVISQKDRRIEELIRETDRFREENLMGQQMEETQRHRERRLLDDKMRALEEEVASDRPFAQACRTIGHMMHLDGNLTPASYAQRLIDAVSELQKELEELQQDGPAMHDSGLLSGHMGHLSLSHRSGLGHSGSLGHSLGHSHGHSHGHGFGGVGLGTDEFAKMEILRNETKLARISAKYDEFRTRICKVLHIHDSDEEDSEIIKNLRRQLRSGSSSSHTPGRHSPHRSSSSSGKLAEYKRKLKTALQTIESQDTWLDLLNKKIESLDKGHTGFGRGRGEVGHLKDEVERLKHHLYGAGHTGSRPTSPFHGGIDSLRSSGNLSQKIQELEVRIEEHNRFREQVMLLLDIPGVTAPDSEIFRKIRDLKLAGEQAEYRKSMSSSLRKSRSLRLHP